MAEDNEQQELNKDRQGAEQAKALDTITDNVRAGAFVPLCMEQLQLPRWFVCHAGAREAAR